MYLMHYGYMDDLQALSGSESGAKSAPLVQVMGDAMRNSIMEFQRFAGLNQTGEIDAETEKMMRMPRCGVKDIVGARPGMYRDGGLIDYHFDVDLTQVHEDGQTGLTLYPHFSHTPRAGWFDKKLNRPVDASHYDHTVMLVPSEDFIAKLPYGKIPDRQQGSTSSFWGRRCHEDHRQAG